jgi:2-oxo-4-hydroxy-4-carboxy-5-ureidoimidazoline decarboxylase
LLVKARPFRTLDRLLIASDQTLGRLDWADLTEALSAHPRIGERAAGSDRESSWSRQEQAATATVPDRTKQLLAEANRAYEARFGYVFLICATGLSSEEMLQSLRSRLGNDPVAEREVVRAELKKIIRLRLTKAFH